MTEQSTVPVQGAVADVDELPEQLRVRREKLDRLRAAGVDPYPVSVPRTHSLAEVRAAYPDLEPDTATGDRVGVTGRVIFIRNTGKLCFATLREGGPDGGTELQAMLSADRVGVESLAAWKADVDLGDHVFVSGEVITSRRGELSVLAERWQLASKALRPLPVAHKPMNEETRVRQRYVDLIVRPEAQQMVQTRYAVQRALRESLHRRGYVEVETPILQAVYGGATARPFTTHMNAFDLDLYLRIAPELFLKRAVVGGIERVFELNRVFRNEGVDSTHNPEFTMLEAYQAHADYDVMATLTRELIQESAVAVFGSTVVTHFDGTEMDLGGEWRSISLYHTVSEAVGEPITPQTSLARLTGLATRLDLQVNPAWPAGKLVEELFEATAAAGLQAPTFVRDFPEETSPLTRQHRSEPGVTEKWDLYILGVERATAYSELVDPVVQRERLVAQSLAAANGDPEAMQLDEDFLRALEYGMPPAGGMGMGIDRLLQVLTGARGVRETVLFPLTRPE
ncbi:MAG TPA: lysine--tRNA ligase [Mycobacteriales bacterium]|nr:lysine--tRNA ligase [Mycobacteriales bacterium]